MRETIDVDFEGFGRQASRILRIRPAVAIAAMGLVSLVVTTAALTLPAPERLSPPREPFLVFPRTMDDWSGRLQQLDPEIEAVLKASDYVNATYVKAGDTMPVNFFSAWYERQTEGTGIHSPEVCLPVGGWEIFSLQTKRVSFPGTVYGSFDVNRAVIQNGLTQQLVYYWFEQRGQRITNDFSAKLSVLEDSLTRGRTDGALVRFVTPIDERETEAEAEARLQALMARGPAAAAPVHSRMSGPE